MLEFMIENEEVISDTVAGYTWSAGIAAAVLASNGLMFFWIFLNTIQIIVHMPLLNMSTPPNVMIFNKILTKVASVDAIPMEKVYGSFLEFPENPKNSGMRFKMLGMETNNFLLNSGTMFTLFTYWGIAAVVTVALGLLMKRFEKLGKLHSFLANHLFYAVLIRLLLESYLELLVACLINLKSVRNFIIFNCF